LAAIEHIHGGNLREAAEKYGLNEECFLDFSANINPLGASAKAIEAITSNLAAITMYPDPGAKSLRRAAAEWLGLPENMIMAGNGAVEIIYLLMKLVKPRRVLIPAPTFNEYEIAVLTNGGAVKDLPLREAEGFILDRNEVYSRWDDTDVLFICNPNNPTGTLTARGNLEEIIRQAAELGKTVVVDEAFMDFVRERENYSVIDMVSRYGNLFVLYSLTKFFAMPGLRLGIGLGSRQVIDKLNQIRDPWNVNCFAQLAGVASLADREYIHATIDYVAGEKQYLFNKIQAIKGFFPYPPGANYVFISVEGTGYTSAEVTALLGQQGILVRDCGSYKNLRPFYIRMAVRRREENEKLIEALQQLGRK